jgi:mRNA-degrading endonuclease toxin of MazEF toxin-antitoxin module
MAVIKRFLEWIQLKEKLHQVRKGPPPVVEGDLWWISFGENIGAEINGKSGLFSRPGLILKKLSREFYLVAPSTTRPKTGSWFYKVSHKGVDMHFCLHQIRTIDYRRISNRLGMVSDEDLERIKTAFWNLYQ